MTIAHATEGPLIRPIQPSDYSAWVELWCAYLAFYETKLSQHVYKNTFQRLLDPEYPSMGGLIAVFEGRAVGFVHYIYHDHCWKTAQTCYLQDLFTITEMRGKGIGRALIMAVYEQAQHDGADGVYWMTQSFNETARRLYDRVATRTPFIKYQGV